MTVNAINVSAPVTGQAEPHCQESPWRRLRYALTEANLLRHLPDLHHPGRHGAGPLRVLDVAGGHGLDAVRLAALGHEVTVLDPAGAMLHRAMEHAEAMDVADRLHVVQAGAHDAPEVFGNSAFDLVLCHNLVQYVADPRAVLEAVLAPLRRGGVLSVLTPNPDFPGAREAADLPAHPAAELAAQLTALGAGLVVRYGVFCAGEDLTETDRPSGYFARMERLELALSLRMPDLLSARFLHLIAHR